MGDWFALCARAWRTSRGGEGACGRHLFPREQRAAGVCRLGLQPPVFCGAPVWVVRPVVIAACAASPPPPPPPLLPLYCAVWAWTGVAGGFARSLRSAPTPPSLATRSLATRVDGWGVLPTSGASPRRLLSLLRGRQAGPALDGVWRGDGAPCCGGSPVRQAATCC